MADYEFTRVERYLSHIRSGFYQMRTRQEERAHLVSLLQLRAVSYDEETVSSSHRHDTLESGFVELESLIEKIDTDLMEYVEERREGLKVIDNLRNPFSYIVIHDRYFMGRDWNTIRDTFEERGTPRSESQIYEYRRQGIENLYPYLPAGWR